jgi:RNA polymerase sigma-70 factor (ECF subfamily)
MRGGNAEIAGNGDGTAGLGSLLFEETTSRFVISGSEGYNPAVLSEHFLVKNGGLKSKFRPAAELIPSIRNLLIDRNNHQSCEVGMQFVQALGMRTESCRPELYPGFKNYRLPTLTILPGSFERLEHDSPGAGGSRSFERRSPEAVNIDLERIVADFYGSLYRFALALTRNHILAADLTQDTFLILAKRQTQIRDGTKIKSWLFTTLRRQFLQQLRSNESHPEVELKPEHYKKLVVDPTVFRSIDAGTILEALSRVNECYRTALELSYLDDLSYKEIGVVLGIPVGTVMSRLARGKEQLKSTLAKAGSSFRRFVVSV